jgi:hypothetical protein
LWFIPSLFPTASLPLLIRNEESRSCVGYSLASPNLQLNRTIGES